MRSNLVFILMAILTIAAAHQSCQDQANEDKSIPQNSENGGDAKLRASSHTHSSITWEEKKHFLPEFMRVTGKASGSLPSMQVVIDFGLETLANSAQESLLENNKRIQGTVGELLENGFEQKEISSQGMQIEKKIDSIYNKETQQYEKTFLGFNVRNSLRIVTKKIQESGKIIDIAVRNGIEEISSVTFLPLSSKVKELEDSLISKAVEDATKKASLALTSLGYEIKSVKSVEMPGSQNQFFGRNRSFLNQSQSNNADMLIMDFDNLDSTPLFEGVHQYSVQVDVVFQIGKISTNSNFE